MQPLKLAIRIFLKSKKKVCGKLEISSEHSRRFTQQFLEELVCAGISSFGHYCPKLLSLWTEHKGQGLLYLLSVPGPGFACAVGLEDLHGA